jgi:choline dehydrogenase-like flavoprotein
MAGMFDFVIVGAGSAGCVLANRLSIGGRKVALIEAGGAQHKTLKVRAPRLYQLLWSTPVDWAFKTEPQEHCAKRSHFWPRGKVLGGTSCLNAMVYIRGNRKNYDDWGVPGWSYADVLPYFKRSEDNVRGASEYHGAGGPMHVSDNSAPSGFARAFVESIAAHCKVPVNDDFNGAEQEGAGHYQSTIKKGHRASTAIAFLEPALPRENLTVLSGAHALGLVLDGDRVKGVRVRTSKGDHPRRWCDRLAASAAAIGHRPGERAEGGRRRGEARARRRRQEPAGSPAPRGELRGGNVAQADDGEHAHVDGAVRTDERRPPLRRSARRRRLRSFQPRRAAARYPVSRGAVWGEVAE